MLTVMAEENATMLEKIQKALRSCSSIIEQGAKLLAVFSATIYVFGYIVTSSHLAQYDIPIKSFIDAQYFAAGLVPGLLFWLTAFVAFLAWNFNPRINDNRSPVKRRWYLANVLAVISIVILFVMPSQIWVKYYPTGLLFIILFGELSIGILIVLLKGETRKWKEWFTALDTRKNFVSKLPVDGRWFIWYVVVFFYFVILFTVAIYTLILVPFSGPIVYEQLPQAYGGGKLQPVQLYVDSQKVPSELLDANVSMAHGLPARTIPLYLIYQTSTEYVVKPINLSEQRVWALKPDVVYAVVVNP